MVELGADLTKPRHVRHFVCVNDAQEQGPCASEVRAEGWDVEERPQRADYPNDWLILGEAHGVADLALLRRQLCR